MSQIAILTLTYGCTWRPVLCSTGVTEIFGTSWNMHCQMWLKKIVTTVVYFVMNITPCSWCLQNQTPIPSDMKRARGGRPLSVVSQLPQVNKTQHELWQFISKWQWISDVTVMLPCSMCDLWKIQCHQSMSLFEWMICDKFQNIIGNVTWDVTHDLTYNVISSWCHSVWHLQCHLWQDNMSYLLIIDQP